MTWLLVVAIYTNAVMVYFEMYMIMYNIRFAPSCVALIHSLDDV